MSHKILVVEDDIHLSHTIKELLSDAELTPLMAHTAEDGYKVAQDEKPDLILLDVMVPSMGGWELCRQLRRITDAPIIFITALGDTGDIVQGLTLGADDYITKPFDNAEFLARLTAHLRRHVGNLTDRYDFGAGEIIVDLSKRLVVVRNREVELTPREFNLLATLVRHAGKVIPTEDLLEEAWGTNYADAKRNIKPYIHYLRKKIEEDPASPQWIKTVRGVGYRFLDP